jgi:hypothetical protein
VKPKIGLLLIYPLTLLRAGKCSKFGEYRVPFAVLNYLLGTEEINVRNTKNNSIYEFANT